MNRQNLPARAVAPDMPGRTSEIRTAPRAEGHATRNRGEASA